MYTYRAKTSQGRRFDGVVFGRFQEDARRAGDRQVAEQLQRGESLEETFISYSHAVRSVTVREVHGDAS